MTDTTSAAPIDQQVIAAWNAQADEHNQWSELGEDEKVEWAVVCAKTTPPAVVEPLTSEQLQHLHHIEEFGLFCDYEEFEQIVRAIEFAHGIGIKKGGRHA